MQRPKTSGGGGEHLFHSFVKKKTTWQNMSGPKAIGDDRRECDLREGGRNYWSETPQQRAGTLQNRGIKGGKPASIAEGPAQGEVRGSIEKEGGLKKGLIWPLNGGGGNGLQGIKWSRPSYTFPRGGLSG